MENNLYSFDILFFIIKGSIFFFSVFFLSLYVPDSPFSLLSNLLPTPKSTFFISHSSKLFTLFSNDFCLSITHEREKKAKDEVQKKKNLKQIN